jgi:hypothetical protein
MCYKLSKITRFLSFILGLSLGAKKDVKHISVAISGRITTSGIAIISRLWLRACEEPVLMHCCVVNHVKEARYNIKDICYYY